MRKSILPVFAILASSLIPMSANADLQNQFYNGPTKICYKFYTNARQNYKCMNANKKILDLFISGEWKISGWQIGVETFMIPGLYRMSTQWVIEGSDLVEYSCKSTESGQCTSSPKREVWKSIPEDMVDTRYNPNP